MMNRHYLNRIVSAGMAILFLGACQSVNIPKIEDIMKSPEFSQDAENIGTDFPDIKDAPAAPTDIRSDKQWDKDAKNLLALRDDTARIPMVDGPNEAESNSEFERLKAKVQAYKKDDPASGPVQQPIPNYKPRR